MSDPRIVVITGTDTGVGKTWVGRSFAQAVIQQGMSCVAIKPIESGCNGTDPEDGELLAEATGQTEPRCALVRLTAPVAPPVAADQEDVLIDFDGLVDQTVGYARTADLAIVEGAGGLLSPLTWQHNTLSLAQRLNASVLVVASNTLGVINHCLLTINALKQHQVPLLGVVFSAPLSPDESLVSNRESLLKSSDCSHALELGRSDSIKSSADALTPILHWLDGNGSI